MDKVMRDQKVKEDPLTNVSHRVFLALKVPHSIEVTSREGFEECSDSAEQHLVWMVFDALIIKCGNVPRKESHSIARQSRNDITIHSDRDLP